MSRTSRCVPASKCADAKPHGRCSRRAIARANVVIGSLSGARFGNFTLIEASTAIEIAVSTGVEIVNVVFERASAIALSVDAVSSVESINSVFFDNEVAVRRGSINTQIDSNIFSGNDTTIVTDIAAPNPLANVSSNCYFANDDLRTGLADTGVGASPTVGDPVVRRPRAPRFSSARRLAVHRRGPRHGCHRSLDRRCRSLRRPVRRRSAVSHRVAGADGCHRRQSANHRIVATWPANLDYRVSSTVAPGSYRLYYKRGGAAQPPFDGTDAGNGTLPSPIDVGTATTYTLENLQPEQVETPIAPRLVSAEGRNEGVIVTWQRAERATGYRVRYGVSALTESMLDVGDVTTATLTGLVNGTTYRIAVSALNQAIYHVSVTAVDNTQNRNESALSPPSSIAIGAARESALSAELTATPTPIEPYPALPNEGCFVATAAFGADWATEVQVLRDFRDELLLTNAIGRRLVRLYYAHGPGAAALLNEHENFKPVVRAALMPIVLAALLLLADPFGAGATLAIGVFALVAIRCRGFRHPRICVIAAALLSSAIASAQEPAATFSPRWTYEIRAGHSKPNLDEYATYYGDDRDTLFGLSGSYRLRDWIEIGAEVEYMHERGVGVLTGTGATGGEVKLELAPIQVFANWDPPTRCRPSFRSVRRNRRRRRRLRARHRAPREPRRHERPGRCGARRCSVAIHFAGAGFAHTCSTRQHVLAQLRVRGSAEDRERDRRDRSRRFDVADRVSRRVRARALNRGYWAREL